MLIKVYMKDGEEFTVNATYTSARFWVRQHLKMENVEGFTEIPSEKIYYYVEITEREIVEFIPFDSKEVAIAHLHQKFLSRIKTKVEDFDLSLHFPIQKDDYGLSEDHAWINDLPLMHNDWDAYIIVNDRKNDTEESRRFIEQAIKEPYLFLNNALYENLLKAAFHKNAIKNTHPNMGITTDIMDNDGATIDIRTTTETCSRLSSYLGMKVIGLKPTVYNNIEGVALLCENKN